MSFCHKLYDKPDFLPVYCNKQKGHSGPHMNGPKLFRWYDDEEEVKNVSIHDSPH